MKEVTYTEMDYYEFGKLVEAHYGRKFDFLEDQECGNDTAHTFNNVQGKLSEYDLARIAQWQQKATSGWMAATLLEDMVRKSVLAPGNYLVKVSW